MTEALARLDREALIALRTRMHTPGLERAALVYTALGEYGALWSASALAGARLDRARRRAWYRAAALVPAALGANALVKRVVRRRRPTLPELAPLGRRPTSLSFPSGHAATAFAGAVAIGALVPAIEAPLLVAAALMALTRPYLGMHYPSDVAAGALLGAAFAATFSSAQ